MPQRTTPKTPKTPGNESQQVRRRNSLERRLEKSLRDLDALLARPAQLQDVDRDYRAALDEIERRLRGH